MCILKQSTPFCVVWLNRPVKVIPALVIASYRKQNNIYQVQHYPLQSCCTTYLVCVTMLKPMYDIIEMFCPSSKSVLRSIFGFRVFSRWGPPLGALFLRCGDSSRLSQLWRGWPRPCSIRVPRGVLPSFCFAKLLFRHHRRRIPTSKDIPGSCPSSKNFLRITLIFHDESSTPANIIFSYFSFSLFFLLIFLCRCAVVFSFFIFLI